MKKLVLSLMTVALGSQYLAAAPSWGDVFDLQKKIITKPWLAAWRAQCIFSPHSLSENLSLDDIKELLTKNKNSQLIEAEKVSNQLKLTQKMINFPVLKQNILQSTAVTDLLEFGESKCRLKTSIPFVGTIVAAGAAKKTGYEPHLPFLAGTYFAFRFGQTLFFDTLKKASFLASLRDNDPKKLMTAVESLSSTFKSKLPVYLKQEGFPDKAIKATLDKINEPSFWESTKKYIFTKAITKR